MNGQTEVLSSFRRERDQEEKRVSRIHYLRPKERMRKLASFKREHAHIGLDRLNELSEKGPRLIILKLFLIFKRRVGLARLTSAKD